MDFGFSIPHRGPLAKPALIKALAEKGEELGYAYLTISDHIVVPRNLDSKYPYSETGEFPGSRSGESMEMMTLMAFVAAVTSKAGIVSSVMVLPHRRPLVAAKQLATIDVLSEGRLVIGTGTGWMREEFEAVGMAPFERRGDVSNEYIRIFKECWSSDSPTFHGEFADFDELGFEPKPVQKPNPPFWIGGESAPALRRVVALGDCWYPVGSNPSQPLDSLALYKARRDELYRLAEKAGRDPATIDLAYSAPWHVEQPVMVDGRRRFLTGAPADIAADLTALRDLGVRHVFMNWAARSMERTVERLTGFMTETRPLIG